MAELDLSFRPRKPTAPTRLTARMFARQFLRHPQTQLLLLFALVTAAAAILTFGVTVDGIKGIVALLIAFPVAEYAVHRFVMHRTVWVRWPLTARWWSVLHHWHHLHPTDNQALFAPPLVTVVAATALSLPVGWLAGGPAGAGAAFPVGFLLMAAYQYMHAGAHLVAEPATRFGKAMRHRHMLHHFHNETINYGMTSPLLDWVCRTSATDPETTPRTPTARDLGYSGELAANHPALADIERGSQRPTL